MASEVDAREQLLSEMTAENRRLVDRLARQRMLNEQETLRVEQQNHLNELLLVKIRRLDERIQSMLPRNRRPGQGPVQEPRDWVEIFTTVAEVIHGFSEVPEVFKLLVLCKGTCHDPRTGEVAALRYAQTVINDYGGEEPLATFMFRMARPLSMSRAIEVGDIIQALGCYASDEGPAARIEAGLIPDAIFESDSGADTLWDGILEDLEVWVRRHVNCTLDDVEAQLDTLIAAACEPGSDPDSA